MSANHGWMLRRGLVSALALGLFACSGETSSDAESSESNYTACADGGTCPDDSADPLVKYEIGRQMGDGDFFEVPLDPSRKLQQITMIYDGRYTVPELDEQGHPKTNDEGATYYKDGMYAHGFVLGADDSREEVSQPKFIDASETDNWHDIPPLSGEKLRVEFSYADRFKNDPDVLAAHTKVRMDRVIIQYKDPDGLTYEVFDYDLNDQLKSKAEIASGGEFAVDFDGTKEIYRVDVRWGDAKPRDANGQYIAGRANGFLTVDDFRSDSRNVAAIETQAFSVQNASARAEGTHRIGVHMNYDAGRVHWMKVFYR